MMDSYLIHADRLKRVSIDAPHSSDGTQPARAAGKIYGTYMNTFIDEGIAHIARIMRPALYGDLGGSYLPSAYWRQRLYQILDTTHLTNAQLRAVDSLLLELDEFDLCTKLPSSGHAQVQLAS